MWYKSGTANFTNGSTVVTGTGTSWVEAATAGEAIQAPDGRIYEIAAVVSATQLTIGQPYLGNTAANQSYAIAPTQGFLRDLAEQAAALVNTYSGTINTAGQGKFGDGTVSAPGVRFVADEDTGMRRVGANALNLVAGGTDVVQVTSSGVTVPALAYTGTLTGGTGVINIGSGQFVKDAIGRIGLGVPSPTQVIDMVGNMQMRAAGIFNLNNSDNTNQFYLQNTGATGGGNAKLSFQKTNYGEVMVIDSAGNLGIGTSSPGAKLDVVSVGAPRAALFRTDQSYSGFEFSASGTTSNPGIFCNGNSLAVWADGAERLRIDSSGNFGLGVTPSAWVSVVGTKALQIGDKGAYLLGTGIGWSASPFLYQGNNAYHNGTAWTYSSSAASAQYVQSDGTHSWFTAPSGTAGNPISFTQAMTLDASGNLGLGVTPSAWNAFKAIDLHSGSVAADSTQLLTASNAYIGSSGWVYKASGAASFALQINGSHAWYTAPSGTAGNPISFTTAMSLDASSNLTLEGGSFKTNYGNTGIVLGANQGGGASLKYNSNGNLEITPRSGFNTVVTAGNLLLGTTGQYGAGKLCVTAVPGVSNAFVSAPSTNAGYKPASFLTGTGVEIGSIECSTTTTTYNTSSDARLKENISDADNGSELIDQLQVRKFDWKADGSHQRYGFVAQELDTVYPEAVSKPTNPEEMMGVDYSKLVPLLVQEIQALRSRVAALEAA